MSSIKMIVGLGNPGPQYSRTRHNIGFLIVDSLAVRLGITAWAADRSSRADVAKGKWENHTILLVKPLCYMNRSGEPAQKIAAYYKILPSEILIVHDDMDLDFGRQKIVVSRGPGGHNGIRSLISAFGTKDFIRLRIGVGRPSNGQKDITGHVLGKFSVQEQSNLDQLIEDSVHACQMLLSYGVEYAMNRINRKET